MEREPVPNQYGRYFIIRVVSRGVDLLVYAGMILYFGLETIIFAFLFSEALDYIIDFWGQKVWVFKEEVTYYTWLEFGKYIGLRTTMALIIIGFFYFLNKILEVSLTQTIVITIVFVWPIVFWVYKKYIFKTGARQ